MSNELSTGGIHPKTSWFKWLKPENHSPMLEYHFSWFAQA